VEGRDARRRSVSVSLAFARAEAEAFLYREARLLDERRFADWLALFADDAHYLVPIEDGDDPLEPMLVNDDRARMSERVYRIEHARSYAQAPPSETVRLISNVEVDAPSADQILVRANVLITEIRAGDDGQPGLGEQRWLSARCRYRLEADAPYRIREKRVVLLNRRAPIYNLTMLL
jgi:3-phenylpropionate/cinnamic acid dioxygenase small subunit